MHTNFDESREGGFMREKESQSSDKPIYGEEFQVDQITNPEDSLPQNALMMQRNYQLSCYQNLCVCCGKCCIAKIACWNVMTCFICSCCCNFTYFLGTSKAGIVEQFGRFTRLLKPGFNYINPCSEEVTEIEMQMKTVTLGKQVAMTKDNIQLTVETIVYYRIINPLKVKYSLGVGAIFQAVKEAAHASIRTTIGENVLDKILSQRATFLLSTKQFLQSQLQARGLQIEHLFLSEMILPPEIMKNLTAAAKQRRLNEAQIIGAQADVQTAKLMKESSELLNTKAAMQIRYLEMLQELSNQNKQMTMFIPIGVNKMGRVK